MNKEIEIPKGYEARIEGNKVIIERKESEDERIRKTLIHIVKGACSKYGIKYIGDEGEEEELLAYLEKQKEREDKLYEKTKDRFYKEGVDDGILIGKEQQKEQKPAEWRPFDKEVLTKIKELIDSHFSEHEQREVYKDWLDEHISQPAEWSEEDEKKIGRLRSIVNDCAFRNDALDVNGDYCEGDYGELDDWLKSLRPQPKQE